MEEERKRKPPMYDAIVVEVNERSQALVVADLNVVIEKRVLGCSRKKEELRSKRDEEESVV
jgi:hypothetical protein